jgi:cytochrome c553
VRNIVLLTLWILVVSMTARIDGNGAAASVAQGAEGARQAQIEKGRVAVTQICVGCHGNGGGIMRMLEVRQKSEEEWRETVYRMIGRGAQVLPDEIEPLTAYLASSARRGRPQAAPATARAGPGSAAGAILARRCQRCHDLETATRKPASEEWSAVIDRMITLGATITAAEQQTLLAYLTTPEKIDRPDSER